jgi:hypothetical protein
LQCGIPLKTAENPRALFTELEVYEMFKTLVSGVCVCVFFG